MAAGLEPGPANPQPFSVGISLRPSFDVIEVLPVGSADRLRKLREHVHDLHALTIPFEDIHEASNARIAAENRLKRLLDHQQNGGFNLCEDDPRVIEQQRLLDKLTDDFKRLNERNEVRSAAWREAGHTLQAVEGWLRDGRSANTALQDYDGEVPKLNKGESLLDGIERLRRRGRELKADLHRIQSAPYPSSYAKQRMRAQIEHLAQAGTPDVSSLVEHDRQIEWPTQMLRSEVHNTPVPSVAFADTHDLLPLIAWLHKDALIKRLDAEIDSDADDAAALTHEARQKAEAEVMADLLAVERDEAALVWRAMDERLPMEHRADCAPQAIVQCRLETVPRSSPSSGSSPMHAWDIVGGRR